MSNKYRKLLFPKGVNRVVIEIKPDDIFYIKHQWFRDLCFYRDFKSISYQYGINEWLDNKYNNHLNNKTYYVVQKHISTGELGTEWLYHKGEIARYTNGVYRESYTRRLKMLTELMMHFDKNSEEKDKEWYRTVYELKSDEEIDKFLYMKELIS